jgi:hypothetical protein
MNQTIKIIYMKQLMSIFTYNTIYGGTSDSDLRALLAIYHNICHNIL